MSDHYKELEVKLEKLARYLELIERNLQDLKEQIDTRTELDKVEGIVLRLAKSFKCRKTK